MQQQKIELNAYEIIDLKPNNLVQVGLKGVAFWAQHLFLFSPVVIILLFFQNYTVGHCYKSGSTMPSFCLYASLSAHCIHTYIQLYSHLLETITHKPRSPMRQCWSSVLVYIQNEVCHNGTRYCKPEYKLFLETGGCATTQTQDLMRI